MKRYLIVTLQLFLLCFSNTKAQSQKRNDNEPDSSQKFLYLNGDNFRLIENAERCFKINSIAEQGDSIVRIWVLDNILDSVTMWRIKMFEFGKVSNVPFSLLHTLIWGYENKSFPVKSVKKEMINPNHGWLKFESDIRNLNLLSIYDQSLHQQPITIDYGMVIIQFMFGHATYTIDFTGLINISYPKNSPQHEYVRDIAYLFWLVGSHFSVDFFSEKSIKAAISSSP